MMPPRLIGLAGLAGQLLLLRLAFKRSPALALAGAALMYGAAVPLVLAAWRADG
jgi:hypothetical protein